MSLRFTRSEALYETFLLGYILMGKQISQAANPRGAGRHMWLAGVGGAAHGRQTERRGAQARPEGEDAGRDRRLAASGRRRG